MCKHQPDHWLAIEEPCISRAVEMVALKGGLDRRPDLAACISGVHSCPRNEIGILQSQGAQGESIYVQADMHEGAVKAAPAPTLSCSLSTARLSPPPPAMTHTHLLKPPESEDASLGFSSRISQACKSMMTPSDWLSPPLLLLPPLGRGVLRGLPRTPLACTAPCDATRDGVAS